MTFLLAIG